MIAAVEREPAPEPGPDQLSAWIMPPPTARAAGETVPIRAFDTAQEALLFLLAHRIGAALLVATFAFLAGIVVR
jgi:hypothetical protein